jgi:hypothetical protein
MQESSHLRRVQLWERNGSGRPDDVLALGYWDESGPTDRHAGRHSSLLSW